MIEIQRQLLTLLDETRAETQAALENLDPDKVIYSESGWRIKDIIGHLTAWEEEVIGSLQAILKDQEYRIDPDISEDEYNDRQFERRRNFSTERFFTDWADTREWMKEMITKLPEDRFKKKKLLSPWGKRDTIQYMIEEINQHEIEHREAILTVVRK